jgi:glycosyltransferase involved in cell wall biosynthesis
MHVLVPVLHRPVQPTGVCRHAANLAACLAALPEVGRITLLMGRWQRAYFETAFGLRSEKIRIVEVDIPNTTRDRNLWFLFGLPRLARQLQANVVHLSFPIPILRRLFSCPVLVTVHDLYAFEVPENFGRFRAVFNRLLFRLCVNQVDGLICISQQTQAQFKRFFPRRAAVATSAIIYNYVDFDAIVPSAPPGLNAPSPLRFVLSVAQHRQNKNIDLLIEAYARLRRFDESALLVIVGTEGPQTEALRALVDARQLSEHVRWLASITDAQLCWLYQHATVFVIASSAEGFCAPLVEALYNGCRVVCSDIPILREIGQSHCAYFELSGGADDNLSRVIESTLLESKPSPLRDPRFAMSTAARSYLAFYRRLLH